MAKSSGGGSSSSSASSKGKKKAAPAAKEKKAKKTKALQRASSSQIQAQLKTVKHIKVRLKDVVGRFEEAYPDGLDFTPKASNADFA